MLVTYKNYRQLCYAISFISITFLGCAGIKLENKPTEKQPNIIFILVDDLGYSDVGFNGTSFYETPNLDALAKESLVFDNAYMYPTCSPSRTALFTGKHSFRTGVYTVPVLEKGDSTENIFSRWTVERKHPIYAEALATAGYQSIHLGKWHIVGPYPETELNQPFPFSKKLTQPDAGDYSWVAKHQTKKIKQYYPEGRGFQKNVGGTFRGDPAFEEGGYKSENGGFRAPFSNPFIDPKKEDKWLTDRLTNDAIDFMEEKKDAPFFVNLHYYTVHRPFKSCNPTLYDKYAKKGEEHLSKKLKDKKRIDIIRYATMVESMDDNVGQIVEYLDKNGLRENTIIVFSSDNGVHGMVKHDTSLRGAKGAIYEGGIRVPTLINWGGKVTPRRSTVAVSCLDFFPTFTDLAASSYNGPLDGHSMTALFSGDTDTFQDRAIFWHLASRFKHGTCTAMRKGSYKLIQFLKDGKLELYDLEKDRKESNNLAESQPELANQLLAEMVAWRKENSVPLPPHSILEF